MGVVNATLQAAKVGVKKSVEHGGAFRPFRHTDPAGTQDQQDQQDPVVAKAQEFISRGAKVEDVLSALGEKFGQDKANQVMYQAIQPKLDSFRAQGAKEEDIQSVLAALGLSQVAQQTSSSADPSLPQSADLSAPVDPNVPAVATSVADPFKDPFSDPGAANRPEVNLPFTAPNPSTISKVMNVLTGGGDIEANPLNLPKEGEGLPSPDDAVAQVNAMHSGYRELALMANNALASSTGLTTAKHAELQQLRDNIAKFKTKVLTDKGYDVTRIDETGAVYIRHPVTGEEQKYTDSVLDTITHNPTEVGLAVATGAAAGSLAIGALPTLALTAAGTAVGAAFGRGIDVLSAAEDLGIQVDHTLLISEMKQAGVADVTLSALGLTGLAIAKLPRATTKLTRSAWDKFVSGNREGAVKALLNSTDMNEAKALALVQDWERLTGNKVLSDEARATNTLATAQDLKATLRVVPETTPGLEGVVKAATSEAKNAGAPLHKQIANRTKDFIAEASRLTNDNIDSLVHDKLGAYVTQTKQTFADVKELGLSSMEDSSYRFNFITTALLPAMKTQARGIHNGALRKDFYHYLDQIRELGGEPTSAAPIKAVIPEQQLVKLNLAKQKTAEAEATLGKSKVALQDVRATQVGLKNELSAHRSELAALKTSRQALRGKQAAAKTRIANLKTKKARDRAQAEFDSLAKDIAKTDRRILKVNDTIAKATQEIQGATRDVTIAAKQVAEHSVVHRTTKAEQKTAQAEAVPAKVSAVTSEATNPNRSFAHLLQLRQVINELSSDTRFKGFNTFKQMAETKVAIDKEIERAALTEMPEGKAWLNQWRAANQEYSNMKNLENNVLYKTLTSPRVTPERAVKAIADSMSYRDASTFMQVMGKMGKARPNVEGAVIKHFMQKHAIGFEGGARAINFPELAAELDRIAFTQKSTQDLKRTVKEFAKVFKNDPHLLRATGGIPLPRFQQSLAVDPVSKAKYAVASVMFNAIRARIPFSSNAGRAALVNNLGKALDDPLNPQAIANVTKALPKNPELETAFHRLAQEFKATGLPEHYGKVPIYRVHAPGQFNKESDTFLGRGMLYFTNKKEAELAAKGTGNKVKEVYQVHKRIATPWDIEKILGHPPSVEELKSFDLHEQLRIAEHDSRGFAGLAYGDHVLLFKQ